MKIALTGGSGSVGRAIVTEALRQGHSIVNIDRAPPPEPQPGVPFVQLEMDDYSGLAKAFAGADAVIHMAAIPAPGHHPDHVVHNNNVVGSYNALRAAAENGIKRVCQASSVNAIGHGYSRNPRYDYFPLDENHPTYNEDPYSLSKWICELQADSFVRRYEDMVIASMRFHWVVPDRAMAAKAFNRPGAQKNLWAYTLHPAAARACLLSLTAPFKGHEAFFIVAPETTNPRPSLELAQEFYPDVPVTGDLGGNNAFFSSRKAELMLGWTHDES
ncbi:MAG TPA: NAD(P)-dependent oxidoreductase [Devosia sp.]|nr:NAD(P)-dependent oxidoreductase [Devosia sp.]